MRNKIVSLIESARKVGATRVLVGEGLCTDSELMLQEADLLAAHGLLLQELESLETERYDLYQAQGSSSLKG